MTDATTNYERIVSEEKLIADTTGLIYTLMDESGVSKAELARRVGRSRGYITQILDGRRNMTLRTLAQLAFALEEEFEVRPVAIEPSWFRRRLSYRVTLFGSDVVLSAPQQNVVSELDVDPFMIYSQVAFNVTPSPEESRYANVTSISDWKRSSRPFKSA